jgi:hypothetical protein
MWGDSPPPADGIAALLDWYDAFSTEHWDFRRGLERNLVASAQLSAGQEESVLSAAEALGLANARAPQRDYYDAVLILGGLVRACLARPAYAAHLLATRLTAGEVVALGGFRSLAGDEVALAKKFGIRSANELHAMVEGVRRAFELEHDPVYANGGVTGGNTDWEVATFAFAPPLSVIAAPSEDPTRRANTVDTYNWWARRKHSLKGSRILLVTTTIYVPYQGAGATQVLGIRFGAEVETVGVPDEFADLGEDTQRFTPTNYLQEIRSAIRGYRGLLTAVTEDD